MDVPTANLDVKREFLTAHDRMRKVADPEVVRGSRSRSYRDYTLESGSFRRDQGRDGMEPALGLPWTTSCVYASVAVLSQRRVAPKPRVH